MKLRTLLVVAVGSCALVAGCADADADAGDDPGSAEAAATEMKYYECRGPDDGGDQMNRIEVGVSPAAIEVTDVSKDAAPPSKGRIDRTYRPSPSYAGAV